MTEFKINSECIKALRQIDLISTNSAIVGDAPLADGLPNRVDFSLAEINGLIKTSELNTRTGTGRELATSDSIEIGWAWR